MPERNLTPKQIADLHHEAVGRVERSRKFWAGTTHLKGRVWFRACPVNFRTTLAHMDRLMGLLETVCGELEREIGKR